MRYVGAFEQLAKENADLRAKLKLAEDALEPFAKPKSRAGNILTGRERECDSCGVTLKDWFCDLDEHFDNCDFRRAAETLAAIRGEK